MSEPKNFKDRLDPALFRRLAEAVARRAPLDVEAFLADLEAAGAYAQPLKARISTAARCLHERLPPYDRSLDALVAAAPSLGMWENLVLTEIVQRYGQHDLERSMAALRALTPHGTGEFAVRPYINRDPERVLRLLHAWAQDEDEHVRRLAAEGTRPRGVWMEHIPAFRRDPRPVIALLERLRADPSLYVRKAVANNLNDISKDHPQLALEVAARWRAEGDPRTDWIVARGLRTLLKRGDASAHRLQEREQGAPVVVERFELDPLEAVIGGEIALGCALRCEATEPTAVAVDYRLHFARPRGRASAKVFHWSRRVLAPGERLSLRARRALADLSTRRHHPGAHRVELLLNGVPVAEARFELRAAAPAETV